MPRRSRVACTSFIPFVDAIASPSTYLGRSVSEWVMFSDFRDSYCICRACELVLVCCKLVQNLVIRLGFKMLLKKIQYFSGPLFSNWGSCNCPRIKMCFFCGDFNDKLQTVQIVHTIRTIHRMQTIQTIQKIKTVSQICPKFSTAESYQKVS